MAIKVWSNDRCDGGVDTWMDIYPGQKVDIIGLALVINRFLACDKL